MDLLLLFLVQVPRAAPAASVVKQRVVVDTVDVVDEDETKNNFPLRLLNNTYNRIYILDFIYSFPFPSTSFSASEKLHRNSMKTAINDLGIPKHNITWNTYNQLNPDFLLG